MLANLRTSLSPKLEQLSDLIGDWLNLHLVNILAILFGAWLVRRFGIAAINRVLKHTVRSDIYPSKADREKRLQTLSTLGSAFMRVAVYIVAGILIIGEIWPSYATALFASAGLFGVAIGFGAQSLVRDFISGIFIIGENQYRIGDDIKLTAGAGMGSINGVVEDITIRTTVMRDLDGNLHHIPNGNIGITTNKTIGFSRINEDMTVAHGTDLNRLDHIVRHVGEQLAADPDLKNKVLQPPYIASYKGLNEKGVVIKILAKTTPADQWRVRSEMYRRLHDELHKSKIKIT